MSNLYLSNMSFNKITKALHFQDLVLNSTLMQFGEVEIINLKYNRFALFNKLAHDWTYSDEISE